MTFRQLQEEQKPWVEHNFTNRAAWHPLLGIIEEIGELETATNNEARRDAIGDCVIYIADYCTAEGYDLQDLRSRANDIKCDDPFTVYMGHLCHAHLKKAQGIRGTLEKHKEAAQLALTQILSCLQDYSNFRCFDFDKVVEETWNEVKQRDWKKNAKDGK